MKLNSTLTTYARSYAAEADDSTIQYLAPEVPTGAAQGWFLEHNERQDFQAYDARRAIGAASKRLAWLPAKLKQFNCTPQSLEIPIDDSERDQSGDEGELLLEKSKISCLINTSVRSDAREVMTVLRTVPAMTGAGAAWSGADDPVEEIDEAIYQIALATGVMPNRLLIGLGAWRRFRSNQKVRNRLPNTKASVVREVDAQGLFLNPAIALKVSMLIQDEANLGQDLPDKKDLVGDDVVIFHASDKPTPYDPSFMKRFRIRRGGVKNVFQYREEQTHSDIYQTNWSNQTRITSPISGVRIRVTG